MVLAKIRGATVRKVALAAAAGALGLATIGLSSSTATADDPVVNLKVHGTVWFDKNNDHLQSGGDEAGIAGVTVTLLALGTEDSLTTTTNASGNYSFAEEQLGEETQYQIKVTKPAGYDAFTTHIASPGDKNSDVGGDGKSNPFTCNGSGSLDCDDNGVDIDAGLIKNQPAPSKVTGLVWHDKDADGLREAGEKLLEGRDVELYTPGQFGYVKVAGTKTNAEGKYEFTVAEPGTYVVGVLPGDDETFSPQGVNQPSDENSDVDSYGISAEFSLPQHTGRIDAGVVLPQPTPTPTATPSATPSGTPSATPTDPPATTPAPTSKGKDKPLPNTGVVVGGFVTAGFALIAAGIALTLAARRRKENLSS